jgi:histone H3/H4
MTLLMQILQRALPVDDKINGDTKEAMNRCILEFTTVLTREAAWHAEEICRTVSGEDIILALGRLNLKDHVGPVTRAVCCSGGDGQTCYMQELG